MQIGFFDSGIGGISVLFEALKFLPQEDYLYYADTLNVPYGIKPKSEVRRYVLQAVDFIAQQGVKALVVACNTATSIAIEELRNRYSFPIIGMEPAVKPAVKYSQFNSKRVLVLATPLTLQEKKFKSLVERVDLQNIVDYLPLPKLVEFAETLEFREEIVLPYLKNALSMYSIENYRTIVLGCTHFPYFKNIIAKLFQYNVDIIDGNIGTVKNLKRILDQNNNIHDGSGKVVFYHSGRKVLDKCELEKYNILFTRLNDLYNT